MNLFRNLFPAKRIYLDYASTTPVLPEVEKVMSKYWSQMFHNPSSIYQEGVDAKRELEMYRSSVAKIFGCRAADIVFTSGGTESANLAIIGAFEAFADTKKRPHVIISAVEHPAVREAAEEVKRRGGEVSVAPVNEFGIVKLEELEKLLKPNTAIVSVMLANNEVGTIEPVARIGRLVKDVRNKNGTPFPYFHTDASQAANYMRLNVETLHTDLLTLDGSKIYGPKGVGILVVRPRVTLRPIVWGGGQERGLRSGTENLALISGFGIALKIAQRDAEKESKRLKLLKTYFIERIEKAIPKAVINSYSDSLPSIVSVSLPNTLGEFILLSLDKEGVMASLGSACGNTNGEGSSVMRALGKPELAESTIRFSFGRYTTKKELDKALNIFIRIVQRVKM